MKAAKADAAGPSGSPLPPAHLKDNPLSDAAKSSQLGDVKKAGVRVEG